MGEAVRKDDMLREVILKTPVEGPVRVKDVGASMAALRKACVDVPEKLEALDTIEALPPEEQERFLLSRIKTRSRAFGVDDAVAACAVIVAVVTVIVGYRIYKYFDEKTKQWREERVPITEEQEVEKEVCEEK